MKRLALAAVLSLLVTACGTESPAPNVDGAWELVAGTHDGTALPLVPGWPITMILDGDSIGGTASCNSYGGRLQAGSAGSFSVDGGLAITEMACMPPEVMEAERLFMEALVDADRISRIGDNLTLDGPSTDLEFRLLQPVPTADLIDTVWMLESLVSQDTVISAQGEPATLSLRADGSFSGSTGCRSISGTYVVTGAEVQFTSFAADGDCPAEFSAQDSRVISALEGGFRVEIDGGVLTTWTSGDEGLIYRASE
ncbi:MAG: META domain-containing protein [Acidimicrobiia bacterium]|nr:META domain-containing protein [Acidimicrobiia bacterium]